MKEFGKAVFTIVVASVAVHYLVREIETDFWRSKAVYGDVSRKIKNFKFCKAE